MVREYPGLKASNKALELYEDLLEKFRSHPGLGFYSGGQHHRIHLVDFYCVLVQCAVRVGRSDFVDEIIDDMTAQGVARPLAFYEGAMKQLASQKQYRYALRIYDRLVADGLK